MADGLHRSAGNETSERANGRLTIDRLTTNTLARRLIAREHASRPHVTTIIKIDDRNGGQRPVSAAAAAAAAD